MSKWVMFLSQLMEKINSCENLCKKKERDMRGGAFEKLEKIWSAQDSNSLTQRKDQPQGMLLDQKTKPLH